MLAAEKNFGKVKNVWLNKLSDIFIVFVSTTEERREHLRQAVCEVTVGGLLSILNASYMYITY